MNKQKPFKSKFHDKKKMLYCVYKWVSVLVHMAISQIFRCSIKDLLPIDAIKWQFTFNKWRHPCQIPSLAKYNSNIF